MKLMCFCGETYEARKADIKRGWGKTCSKRCAAIKREYGRPNATQTDGGKVMWGKKYKRPNPPVDKRQQFFDEPFDPSWDAHKDELIW